MQILQRYVDQSGNQKVQKACDTIDDFLTEELLKTLKQKKIGWLFSMNIELV
jgi:hypothetical protein